MTCKILNSIALVALGLSSFASAHTWIEQLMVVAPNGTMIGQPGFARGNVLRSDPGFSDPTMVNLIPPNGRTINTILSSDLMCKSSQTSQSQTNGSPRLQAAPGANLALRYQENGHVTLPQNQPGKPSNRGTVYVYGTTQPSPTDTFLSIHRVWTPDGTGGDGRGVLLSTQNFDDGQCYQVNSGAISTQRQAQFSHTANSLMGADLWCQQDIALPADASGTYTLYWVWDWPTLPGTAGFPDGKQEIYTTCMDVDVSGSTNGQSQVASNNFIAGQSLDNAAIESELADIANPTAVVAQTIPFSGGSGGAPTAGASALSGSATAFTIVTTNPNGGHSVISPSTISIVPVAATTNSAGGFGFGSPSQGGVPAASSAAPAPASTTDSGRGGHHSHGGFSVTSTPDTPAPTPATTAPAVLTTNASGGIGQGQGQQAGATFTDWESVTMTVFQTIFNKKRGVTQTALNPLPTQSTPTSSCKGKSSKSTTYTLRGRFYPIAPEPQDHCN